jgi:hypothetical protein
MELTHEPLIAVARRLYDMPRGEERFREYLRTIVDARTGDLALPLVGLNPMGREHVRERLDELVALSADRIAHDAVVELQAEVRDVAGAFRVALCLSDDQLGGWTDRAAAEFTSLFEHDALTKRGWIVATLWSSETYDAERITAEVRAAVLRVADDISHGTPRTLSGRLEREARIRERARCSASRSNEAELASTARVLAPHLESTDWPTAIAALFGDDAARRLGLAPLGLDSRAAITWARAGLR